VPQNKKVEARFSITPEVAQGHSVNHFRITGSVVEFVLDYGRMMPQLEITPILGRIILSPLGVKVLAKILTDTVVKYEEVHGAIKEDVAPLPLRVDTTIKN
jgi:hypothetical protein